MYNTPLKNLKMVDQNYDGLVEIARDIKKQEQKNPNAYNWHILNSQMRFEEEDQIQKMKKA
jgi:hypothetical protein